MDANRWPDSPGEKKWQTFHFQRDELGTAMMRRLSRPEDYGNPPGVRIEGAAIYLAEPSAGTGECNPCTLPSESLNIAQPPQGSLRGASVKSTPALLSFFWV
jgi:hypothetical protein